MQTHVATEDFILSLRVCFEKRTKESKLVLHFHWLLLLLKESTLAALAKGGSEFELVVNDWMIMCLMGVT